MSIILNVLVSALLDQGTYICLFEAACALHDIRANQPSTGLEVRSLSCVLLALSE